MAEWVGSRIARDAVKKQVSTSHERTRPNKITLGARGASHRQTQDSIMDSMKMTPRLGHDADADDLVNVHSTGRCKFRHTNYRYFVADFPLCLDRPEAHQTVPGQ